MSARLALSITDSLSVCVNRLYFHRDSKRIVRWKNKLRMVVCSCDLDLELLCEGNQRISRCTTKVGSTGQPGVVAPAATRSGSDLHGGGASKVLSGVPSPLQLHSREPSLIQHLHVIPADHSHRHGEIVILSAGRWDAKLELIPAYTHKAYTSGGQLQEPFPLMPGSQWHRSFQGKHAAVVHKARVTILFDIQMSVTSLEQPLFVARDFQGGLFCKRLSATSMGALEKAWLSQNQVDGDPAISLSKMKGASFMGLDIPALTEYFRSKVPSFQGFRSREKERGRSQHDIGSRQLFVQS